MTTHAANRNAHAMTLLLLEALGALVLFVLLIWWTMFSGRPKGELPPERRGEDHPTSGAVDPDE